MKEENSHISSKEDSHIFVFDRQDNELVFIYRAPGALLAEKILSALDREDWIDWDDQSTGSTSEEREKVFTLILQSLLASV